jgi:hypothetical protein
MARTGGTHIVRCHGLGDTVSVENEAVGPCRAALSLRVHVHQLLQRRLALDLEEDLSGVLSCGRCASGSLNTRPSKVGVQNKTAPSVTFVLTCPRTLMETVFGSTSLLSAWASVVFDIPAVLPALAPQPKRQRPPNSRWRLPVSQRPMLLMTVLLPAVQVQPLVTALQLRLLVVLATDRIRREQHHHQRRRSVLASCACVGVRTQDLPPGVQVLRPRPTSSVPSGSPMDLFYSHMTVMT